MKLTTILTHGVVLAQACLLPHERLVARNRAPSIQRDNTPPQFPVGTGDRFEGGKTVPVGLGFDDRDLESVLNSDEIKSGLKGLADAYHDVDFFTLPHKTYEKRSVYGIAVGEPRVYLNAGIHARERGGPDNVLYFVADLLRARKACAGLTYGNKTYTSNEVKKALSAGVVIVPLSNPDGVAYDVATNGCWRKNRNPASADPDVPSSVGVDLNRNFDFVWDFRTAFNNDLFDETNQTANMKILPASDYPEDESFHGTSPNSEPETKNIAWVLEEFEDLSWFLDLHSYSPAMYYAWGDDDPQTTDPSQNFKNPAYDGLRGYTDLGFEGSDPANSTYAEYMEAEDLDSQKHIANLMADTMTGIGPAELEWWAITTSTYFPTSGGTTDYAAGMYYGKKCGANRIQALGMEFGIESEEPCVFYPSNSLYHQSMRQVGVGFMELLLWAAGEAGDKKTYDGEECG